MTRTTPEDNDDEQQQHEESFARDGFLVLRNVLAKHQLQEWQQFASMYFQQIFHDLHQHGHTQFASHCRTTSTSNAKQQYAMGLGVKHGFREIVMRSPGRYELSLLHSLDKAPSIEALQNQLFPCVPALLGAGQWDDLSLCHLSLVVSTPGAAEQSWHADGGHVSMSEHLPCHVANIFIPLVHVTPALGPTEFRPGSHVYTRNLAPLLLAAKARQQLRPTVAPTLQPGDALLFDYRVLHRGKANQTRDQNRPILVLTFAKPWYKDVCNFPTQSLYDPSSSSSSHLPEGTSRKAI
jgi:ectoine hydroxylase-related dioxygenase (phytanoyl-CoA dioxygenase family)